MHAEALSWQAQTAMMLSGQMKLLFPQVAVEFVDLHDTPIRMKEKGVIREIIPWRDTRRHLFWRLRRRLLENKLMHKVIDD